VFEVKLRPLSGTRCSGHERGTIHQAPPMIVLSICTGTPSIMQAGTGSQTDGPFQSPGGLMASTREKAPHSRAGGGQLSDKPRN
jgi:hypothetical protein